jgi:hypothetical protein
MRSKLKANGRALLVTPSRRSRLPKEPFREQLRFSPRREADKWKKVLSKRKKRKYKAMKSLKMRVRVRQRKVRLLRVMRKKRIPMRKKCNLSKGVGVK